MNSQRTLQTLPLDCLFEIVSHLSLPECLELRTVCSQMKAAVDEHFRIADTLPVVLSTARSHAVELELEARFRDLNCFNEFGYVTFGPSVTPHRCLTMFEDQRILHKQQHFRREDFFILPNTPANINSFIGFITEYMPRVSKLALIIDYDHTLVDKNMAIIQRILTVYKKQLKVLLLSKTARSGYRSECYSNSFVLPETFYVFMKNFVTLQELYFFSNRDSRLRSSTSSNDYVCTFIKNMLPKLRVFHMSSNILMPEFEPIVFETLEEMDYSRSWEYIHQHPENFRFPALNKLYISPSSIVVLSKDVFTDCLPNLKTLHLNSSFTIEKAIIESLNNISQLEQLYCYGLTSPETLRKLYHPDLHYRFEGTSTNQTIKHLVVENLTDFEFPRAAEWILEEVRLSLPYFAVLKTVTIRNPFMKLTIEELLAQP